MDIIDPPHTRANLKQLETAIVKGFDIPDVILEQSASRMAIIMKEGTNREKIAAARVIVAMQNSNQPRMEAHLHQHYQAVAETAQPEPEIATHHEPEVVDVERQRQRNAARLDRLKRLGRHS